jgi:hypothetical protein
LEGTIELMLTLNFKILIKILLKWLGKNANEVLKQSFVSLTHYCDILDEKLN